MQENKFEKEVQRKMEELSFTPSAPVWSKIEAQIRKKKDKRRFVFWLLPFLLISTAIIFWISDKGQKPESFQVQPDKRTLQTNTNRTTVPSPKEDRNKIQEQHNIDPGTEVAINNSSKESTSLSHLDIARSIKKEERFQDPVFIKDTENQTVFHQKKNDLTAVNEAEQKQKTETPVENTGFPPAQEKGTDNNTIIKNAEGKDTITSEAIAAPIISSSGSVKKKLLRAGSWQWGVQARVGISGISTSAFHFGGAASADPNSSSAIGLAIPPRTPAPVQNGASFAAAIQLRKKLERFTLTAGIQYNYYSTHQKVGQSVIRDTVIARSNFSSLALERYYRNDNSSSTHRNTYHFIELPVEMSYQVFKDLPFQWHAGLGISRLINADVLVYDRTANLYYKDNSLLKKTQVNGIMALTYKVWKRDKASLLLGPQGQYNLTPVNKEGSKKQHLYFLGLQTQLSF